MSRHATLEKLSSYLDGELPERQRLQVTEHVADCRRCRERLAGLRRVVDRLAALQNPGPPAHLGVLMGQQVRREPRPRGPFERLERRIAEVDLQPSLAPTFALVILLAVVVYVFAVAVDRHRSRGVPVILNPPPLAGESVADQADEPEVGSAAAAGGREFVRLDGAWVERGLEGEAVVERLQLDGPGWRRRHPELVPFASLGGRVRLRLDGRPVEVDFPPDGPG